MNNIARIDQTQTNDSGDWGSDLRVAQLETRIIHDGPIGLDPAFSEKHGGLSQVLGEFALGLSESKL